MAFTSELKQSLLIVSKHPPPICHYYPVMRAKADKLGCV